MLYTGDTFPNRLCSYDVMWQLISEHDSGLQILDITNVIFHHNVSFSHYKVLKVNINGLHNNHDIILMIHVWT